MPTIKPYRDRSEHEILNLFGANSTDLSKGSLVKIATGWTTEDNFITDTVGATYANTVSTRYGVTARVTPTTSTGDTAIGITLHDVKEFDENGQPLKFYPRKQAEMNCVLSGQAVPILMRGIVIYSGAHGSPAAGSVAYTSGNGTVTTVNNGQQIVGRFLGANDSRGFALLKISL